MLVKNDMLQYMLNVRAATGMRQSLSDNHAVLCKVVLVSTWIKRRQVMNGIRKIRSKKLREYQYIER